MVIEDVCLKELQHKDLQQKVHDKGSDDSIHSVR